jgi:hypothetical protein
VSTPVCLARSRVKMVIVFFKSPNQLPYLRVSRNPSTRLYLQDGFRQLLKFRCDPNDAVALLDKVSRGAFRQTPSIRGFQRLNRRLIVELLGRDFRMRTLHLPRFLKTRGPQRQTWVLRVHRSARQCNSTASIGGRFIVMEYRPED